MHRCPIGPQHKKPHLDWDQHNNKTDSSGGRPNDGNKNSSKHENRRSLLLSLFPFYFYLMCKVYLQFTESLIRFTLITKGDYCINIRHNVRQGNDKG